jgi:hypothetical protein
MAISIANQWPAAFADTDAEILANPTAGRTLIAVIVSRVVDGSAPLLGIGDVSRNGWTLLADPYLFASVPHLGQQLQVEVWACPSVRYDGWPYQLMYASAMQITAHDTGSAAINIIEVSGLANQPAVDSVTPLTGSGMTAFTMTAPAPSGGANVLQIAAAATDLAYSSYTTTGTGWTQLGNSTATGPDLGLLHAWREGTTGGSVTFTLSTSQAWTGVIVALKTAGAIPTQPNPAWPATSLQVGLGYTLGTPMPRVRWTDQTSRYRAFSGDRGIQAELGTAQQGQSALTIRNDDGAYTPRTAGSATANATGTTTTIKIPDAQATNINTADFFKITRGALNTNTGFESGTTGWSATGGTLSAITSGARSGTTTGQLVPDGVTATAQVKPSSHTPVTAGSTYVFSAWLQCAVARVVELRAIWLDGSNVFISNNVVQITVTSGTWTYFTATLTAPAGAASADIAPTMTGTPPASNVLLVDDVVLKPVDQLDVFQVTGLASAGGTTTVTFKRADGVAGGAAAATASGDQYVGVPVDLYTPWRLVKTVAGTSYTVACGWLKDLSVAFDDAHWSDVTAASADAVEALSSVANPSAARGEFYRRTGLYAYWPLDDSSGSGYAANASGVSNVALKETVSKYGGGSATADFGAATQEIPNLTLTTSLLGDPGTGWQQDGLTAAEMNAQKGYALVGNDPNFPPIANGVTIVGSILTTQAQLNIIVNATNTPTTVILRNGDPGAGISAGSIIKVAFDNISLLPIVTVWDKDTHAASSSAAGSFQLPGVEWGSWALTFNRTSWSMYIDGDLTGSGSCDLVANFTGIEIGGEASPWYHGKAFPATHAHIAIYNRILTAGELNGLATIVKLGTASNDAGYGRVLRKLNAGGWRGPRAINANGPTFTAEEAPSGSVFDAVSEVLGYQDGDAFVDAAGQVQGRTQARAFRQSPRAVLGDGPGEIPFQPGQAYGYNPTYLYNDVEVENATVAGFGGTVSKTTLVAVNDTSAARYGIRTLARSTRTGNDSPAWHLAWWLLARYAYPRLRVASITVSAAASNDTASSSGRWAFVCSIEVGDIVTVNRRPLGQPTISLRCQVLQVSTNFTYGDGGVTAEVSLVLGAAPPRVAICGDTTLGVLAGTALGI